MVQFESQNKAAEQKKEVKPEKADPAKEALAGLHEAIKLTPRTAEIDPEKDPKLSKAIEIQQHSSYLIKLHRASLSEKIDLVQERIKPLDTNSPDFVKKWEKENEILQAAINNPKPEKELKDLEERVAKSKQSTVAATAVLRKAYDALKAGDGSLAEKEFKLADEHLEKAVRAFYSEKQDKK